VPATSAASWSTSSTTKGNLAVIVDLHDASAPDARGLSALATAAERAGRRGATLTLADPPDELHEPLALLGLARLVHITHHERRRPSPLAPFGRISR